MILGLSEQDETERVREFFAELARTEPNELRRVYSFFKHQAHKICMGVDFVDQEPDGALRVPLTARARAKGARR